MSKKNPEWEIETMHRADHIRDFMHQKLYGSGSRGKVSPTCEGICDRKRMYRFFDGFGTDIDIVEAVLNKMGYTLKVEKLK